MFRRIPAQISRRRIITASSVANSNSANAASSSSSSQSLLLTAVNSSLRFYASSSGGGGDGGAPTDGPGAVVNPSFDRFGGESTFRAPAAGEEMDLTTGLGSRVPWPEVQRQLQLFVSNAVADPKSATRGRTFLRDFDVLSNISSISEGLELLYYIHRLSYPPNSKLEVSLVSWLHDNIPLINSTHLLDMCRYAVEQKSYEHWKRCVLLTDAFIPHMIDILESGGGNNGGGKKGLSSSSSAAASGGGEVLMIEDYILVARVLQHSREEFEDAQKKSLMPGVEYSRKRPIFKVLVQRVAELVEAETSEEEITPEVIGNIVKHVATLDPSCPAQGHLLTVIESAFRGASAVDAMRYLTAMSESGAGFPILLEALVDRIDQHARKALAPAPSKKGQRKTTKKASIKAIRDDPDKHDSTEAIVDVTYITRAFLLIAKISRESADPSTANKLLKTLRPAVDTIIKLLSQRMRLIDDPARLTRLLSDLTEVSDIVSSALVGPEDPMVVAMRQFVREYVQVIDVTVQQGATVDSLMMEECGYCLKIASKLSDTDLASEIGAKVEELCNLVLAGNANTAKNAANQIPAISLEGSLRIIEGLAAVGSFPPRIIEACVKVCLENRPQLSSRDVSAVIFVAGLCKGAQFDTEIFHQLTGRLLNTAKFRRNDVLGPNAVAQLLRGLAAASIKPDERLQAFLSEQALKYTSEFSVRDSTSLLIVVHQLKLDQSTVGQRLGIEVASSIPMMNADDLVRLSSVLAELNLRDVCMLDAIGFRLRDCFDELKPRHLTEFAMSLRELNFSTMFAKCGLADLVPAIEGLSPNEATFLMAFCSPSIQEVIIAKFVKDVASLKQLSPASLITVYGAAPDYMTEVRDAALLLLHGKECPLTVSADVGCLAICRAIGGPNPQAAMTSVTAFLHPIANKFTSTQMEVIIEHLRRAVAEGVPAEIRRMNEEREMLMEKEDKIAGMGKESVISKYPTTSKGGDERKASISLRGSTFLVPASFYRFLGRRVCANIDFLSAETSLCVLEIYQHGRVRDDKVVKTLFRRLTKAYRPIVNSPRLSRIAISLVDYFSAAWSGGFAQVMKQRTSIKTRDLVRTALTAVE